MISTTDAIGDGQKLANGGIALVRSKNAGPFVVTIDIMCFDADAFDRVRDTGIVDAVAVAHILGSDQSAAGILECGEASVEVFEHPSALSFKFTIPRRVAAGSVGDTDVFGCQFGAPIVRFLLTHLSP